MSRMLLLVLVLVVLLSGSSILFLAFVHPQQQAHAAALLRWDRQSIESYRILVTVRLAATSCIQDLEVQDGQAVRVLRDTCNRAWLGKLTVNRLFELSALYNEPGRCFPSRFRCPCHRVRIGTIAYDATTGYPKLINWRRELRPNWLGLDYWERRVTLRPFDVCGNLRQQLDIQVLAIDPLTTAE